MVAVLTSSGDNSAFIEYTNLTTYVEILTELKTFLLAHGWTAEDAGFWDDGTTKKSVMTYKAPNLDGTTFKYIQIGYQNVTDFGFYCKVYEGYDSANKLGTNVAYNSDLVTLWHQRYQTLAHIGRLHVFATARYFMMMNLGTTIGSKTGFGFTGCFETSVANVGDNTPHHFWMNSHLATGANDVSHNYCISPPRTAAYIGSEAALYNVLSTPIGGWGYATEYMYTVIPSVPPPFGETIKHHVFDIIVSYGPITSRYVKGKVFGLKAFTTNVGANGDIFTVKCDSNMFLSNSGTNLNHFIISMGANGTWGIPL